VTLSDIRWMPLSTTANMGGVYDFLKALARSL
jgi:hypothetical protein